MLFRKIQGYFTLKSICSLSIEALKHNIKGKSDFVCLHKFTIPGIGIVNRAQLFFLKQIHYNFVYTILRPRGATKFLLQKY